MKHIIALPLVATLLASPASAQEEPSLMERGAQLFFEGLMEEMSPALDEMSKLLDDAGPALQDFMVEMGPKLREVLDEVEDWSAYEAPEVLENGDIIMRRKTPEAAPVPEVEQPQIDL